MQVAASLIAPVFRSAGGYCAPLNLTEFGVTVSLVMRLCFGLHCKGPAPREGAARSDGRYVLAGAGGLTPTRCYGG